MIHVYERRRVPRPTRTGWALGLLLLCCLAAAGRVAAQEVEQERFSPSSRGTRAAVLERADVEDIAAEVFGVEFAPYVARIAWCESSHRPGAQNAGWDRVFGWFDYRGLMQVSTMWAPLAFELTGSTDLFDPWVNLVTARGIQRQQGWRAWPWCSR